MEDQTETLEIVFDGRKFIYSMEVLLSLTSAIGFVYLERVKNFEKFNFDTKQRDKMLVQLVILQSICLT